MTAKFAAGGGSLLVVGLAARSSRAGARVAEAGAAGGHHSLPAQYCGCGADARAAGRSHRVLLRRTVRALRGCRRRHGQSAARCAGSDCLRRRPWRGDVADRARQALAREHGELIARAVKAFGFNTTLAPVVDLALPESAEVLGTRRRRADARRVITYAREFLAGLAAHGSRGLRQAFPGPGRRNAAIRILRRRRFDRNWKQMWSEDLVPYRELHDEMPMIMMNHAAYPRDAGQEPAGERFGFLDHEMSAQADRLSRHYSLRRSGDGRHSQVPADR